MENLLKFTLEPLVQDIKKVKIEKSQEDRDLKFTIYVSKDDIAKVIGKNGKMIKSIKNLMKIRAIKENIFVSIDVQEA